MSLGSASLSKVGRLLKYRPNVEAIASTKLSIRPFVNSMVANSVTWTIHDLDSIPDDGGWKRYEIIDGELFVTREPHVFHQGAANRISTRLENWSEKTGLGRSFQAPGVVFTDTDAVIPDIVWVSNERLETGLDDAGHFVVAPELIVEVLSSGGKMRSAIESLS